MLAYDQSYSTYATNALLEAARPLICATDNLFYVLQIFRVFSFKGHRI